jgi:hypothetical protein
LSWLQTLPFILVAALFLLLPGGLVTVALGLRGLPAAAGAAPVTVSIASVLAVLLPFAGLPWSAAAVAAGGILLSALVLAFRRAKEGTGLRGLFADLLPRSGRSPGRIPGTGTGVGVAAAFAAGAALILVELALAFVTPESFSQTFDNVFHLNGVRYILDTGSASSLTMSKMTSGDAEPYFYPAAWHGLATALIQLTGLPITVAVNVLNMAVAAIVWPLGCMLLTRTVAGNRPVAVGAAGILSAMFAAFPILLLDFGVLYPNFLAICILPAALAAVAVLFGVARHLKWPPLPRFALPLLIIPGLALAHPNGFMSLVILSVPIALQSYVRCYLWPGNTRREHRTRWILATLGLAAGGTAVYALWSVVRPPEDAAFWPPPQTPRGAILDLLTNGAVDRPAAVGVSVLMLLGLFLCWRRGGRTWMLAGFAITAVLYVVVSGTLPGDARSALTGVWYNDTNRIAALLPLTALPFAAVAVDALAAWLPRTTDRLVRARRAGAASRPEGNRGRLAFRIVAGLLVAVFAVSQVPSMRTAIVSARKNYEETDHSPLVTAAEQRIIDRLDGIVPPDAAIAVNPWTGGALAYALAGRETTAKHILTANTADVETLNRKLRDADRDPSVCAALAATGVRYVLDFGSNEVHFGNHPFPGLQDLNNSLAVRLVLSDGPARLYEVTACR